MKQQRILGVILVLLCILIVLIAAQGTTPEEQDVTAVVFLLPLGLYAMFGKKKIVYDLRPAGRRQKTAAGEMGASAGGSYKGRQPRVQ